MMDQIAKREDTSRFLAKGRCLWRIQAYVCVSCEVSASSATCVVCRRRNRSPALGACDCLSPHSRGCHALCNLKFTAWQFWRDKLNLLHSYSHKVMVNINLLNSGELFLLILTPKHYLSALVVLKNEKNLNL